MNDMPSEKPRDDFDDLPPLPEREPRHSRARDRQQRRREKSMVRPAGSSPSTGQLRPVGGFKLPEFTLPNQARWGLYAVGALLVVWVVISLLGRFKSPTAALGGTPNALWLGTEWTYDQPSDEQFTVLQQRLTDTRIGTIYAWVSLLQPNGAWTDTGKLEQVKAFVKRLKTAYPTADIYGWLSIGAQDADGNDRLGKTDVQQNIADFSGRVVNDFGFDGLLLNVAPVLNGDENFLALLRRVRLAIGDDAPLGVAVPPDWTPQVVGVPTPAQIAPGTVWDTEYKQRVAILAKQMVVAAYNTGLQTAADYSAWMAYQVQAFSTAITALNTATELIMGVPTYDAVPPSHDAAVENVESAITGIRAGIQQTGAAAQALRGIGIYAEWETSETEWRQLQDLWVGG